MLLLFLSRLERASVRLVLAVCMIAIGVAAASWGEMRLSILGLTAMLASVVAEASRLVLTQHLLVGRNFHPLEAWCYMGPACCFWLVLQVRPRAWRAAPAAERGCRCTAAHAPGRLRLHAALRAPELPLTPQSAPRPLAGGPL
jgi:drug/metabolite transporter (DMT)-like permease